MDSAPSASPIASGNIAEFESQVLINQEVQSLPDSPATLFIARAVFDPGSMSGEQQLNGPLGIYTERGNLSIMSPSGVEGQLAPGLTQCFQMVFLSKLGIPV